MSGASHNDAESKYIRLLHDRTIGKPAAYAGGSASLDAWIRPGEVEFTMNEEYGCTVTRERARLFALEILKVIEEVPRAPSDACPNPNTEALPPRTDGRAPGRLAPNRFHEAAWVVGPSENLDIADDVWVGAFCVLDAAHAKLSIGRGSVVACGAHVYTHSSVRRTRERDGTLDRAPTRIGARVSICANAVVLMGCLIGDGAVVGAGAVVLEGAKIGPDETWAGVPARRVG